MSGDTDGVRGDGVGWIRLLRRASTPDASMGSLRKVRSCSFSRGCHIRKAGSRGCHMRTAGSRGPHIRKAGSRVPHIRKTGSRGPHIRRALERPPYEESGLERPPWDRAADIAPRPFTIHIRAEHPPPQPVHHPHTTSPPAYDPTTRIRPHHPRTACASPASRSRVSRIPRTCWDPLLWSPQESDESWVRGSRSRCFATPVGSGMRLR